MSGKVVLIDNVSTNRIILKVKLSAAYYDVVQCSTLEDAVAVLPGVQPDLIMINAQTLEGEAAQCLNTLRLDAENDAPPVVLFAESPSEALRITALNAGFDDVLGLPAQENYMLARLRGLIRSHRDTQSLRLQTTAARALGFAEQQHGFERRAHVSVVTDDRVSAERYWCALDKLVTHKITTSNPDTLMGRTKYRGADPCKSDMCIADLRHLRSEDALQLVADLRSSSAMQDTPILPLVAQDARKLAASLLDMGFNDVLFAHYSMQEISLRLAEQLRHKRASDDMRKQIRHSIQAAMTDPLTGLYNRRYAMSYLKGLLVTPGDADQTLAVMVADLDHFKQINDTYGHAAGDAVLAQVSHALGAALSENDLVARIGGEEFLIILTDTSRFEAHHMAEKLCRTIQRMTHSVPGGTDPIGVTISIGVTLCKASDLSSVPMDARASKVLEQADRALYRSKAGGRNTVTLSARTAA
ncbi:MAG: diguanylate cyclase [Roseovarius sp.]